MYCINRHCKKQYLLIFSLSKSHIFISANESIKYSISIQTPQIAYNALLFFCNFIQTDKVHTFSFRFFKMNLFGINNQIRVEVIVSFDKTEYSEFAESYGFVGFMCRIGICKNIRFSIRNCCEKNQHFMAEIPFMATENIMMDAVKEGGNRQELHEKIRQLSMQAGKTVKEEGKDNNLVDLIAADPAFGLTKEQIEANLKPELYVGRAPRQVEVFLRDVVRPVLDEHKEELGVTAEINV